MYDEGDPGTAVFDEGEGTPPYDDERTFDYEDSDSDSDSDSGGQSDLPASCEFMTQEDAFLDISGALLMLPSKTRQVCN